jgi:hypothetical protein
MDHDSRPLFWSVWRTDDTGNTFLVRAGLTEAEALRLVAEFTARGHKQYYFAEEEPERPQPLTPPARS